uniref:Cholesterol side-chain cleavage enzyme, mitochondrial n=1 Tax=Malurus cyaneus samueli TaxID=2593467 RepID=A0A8C5TX03_9PASS
TPFPNSPPRSLPSPNSACPLPGPRSRILRLGSHPHPSDPPSPDPRILHPRILHPRILHPLLRILHSLARIRPFRRHVSSPPEDAATLFRAEGTLPERFRVPPWVAYRDYRNKPYGVLLKGRESWRSRAAAAQQGEVLSPAAVAAFVPLLAQVAEDFVQRARAQARLSGHQRWTADFSHELFRFALESVCHVLYGQRLGLLQDFVEAEAQRFIAAVALMFHTTAPMLHVPPALLRRLNAPAWRRHVQAWDAIFAQADKCIQSVYRDLRLQRKSPQEHVGVLGNLILRDAMALGDIRASVTEMMAGGVDTVSARGGAWLVIKWAWGRSWLVLSRSWSWLVIKWANEESP